MPDPSFLPRILFITSEVIFFPGNNRNEKKIYSTRRGKKIDYFASLLNELYHVGFNIHIAQPDYRKVFSFLCASDDKSDCSDIPGNRLHLARDRFFYYTDDVDVNRDWDNIKISLAFQREIIQHFIPMIQPDLIHCHDWMTGLIPAAAARLGIPCLFTVYDIRSKKVPLWQIEEMGIDTVYFWESLFYDRLPVYYEETRETNFVDLLLSGIYAAHYVNAASLGFMSEIIFCQKGPNKDAFRQLLAQKHKSGCLSSSYKHVPCIQEYIELYNWLLRDFAIKSAG